MATAIPPSDVSSSVRMNGIFECLYPGTCTSDTHREVVEVGGLFVVYDGMDKVNASTQRAHHVNTTRWKSDVIMNTMLLPTLFSSSSMWSCDV